MKRIIPLVVLVCALAAVSSSAATLEQYRTAIHNQHAWTNRALANRCRDRVTLDEFTKTPLAAVSRDRRSYHKAKAHAKHEAAQALGSACVPTAPVAVIRYVFGAYGDQALAVASCETGGTFSVWATNGQYVGLFQMGSSERQTYGWYTAGAAAITQARSAYRYFVASGRDWSPWQCQPDGGLAW